MPSKCEDLSLDWQHSHKENKKQRCDLSVPQSSQAGDRRPQGQAGRNQLRVLWDTLLKYIMWRATERDFGHQSLASTYTLIHACAHTPENMNTHTHKTCYVFCLRNDTHLACGFHTDVYAGAYIHHIHTHTVYMGTGTVVIKSQRTHLMPPTDPVTTRKTK